MTTLTMLRVQPFSIQKKSLKISTILFFKTLWNDIFCRCTDAKKYLHSVDLVAYGRNITILPPKKKEQKKKKTKKNKNKNKQTNKQTKIKINKPKKQNDKNKNKKKTIKTKTKQQQQRNKETYKIKTTKKQKKKLKKKTKPKKNEPKKEKKKKKPFPEYGISIKKNIKSSAVTDMPKPHSSNERIVPIIFS